MDIIWHGQSCFTIKGKKGTVVTNPFADDVKSEKLKGDIILVTDIPSEKGGKKPTKKLTAVAGEPKIFDIPGEYEVTEIAVIGMPVPEDKKTVYLLRVDDMAICFLGNIDKPLPAEAIEKIGDVDVLMIPVGGIDCLDAKKAHELIESIEPRIVVPMSYEDLTMFMKNSGVTPEAKDIFSIANKGQLPQDKLEYVVLNVK